MSITHNDALCYNVLRLSMYDCAMPQPDADRTLRAFARLLAPYLADVLREREPQARIGGTNRARGWRYDLEDARDLVGGLNRETTEHALVFFDALRHPPNRIDASTLADQLGAMSGRAIAGMLTTPLKRHAARLGLEVPWDEPERAARDATVWTDREGNAARIYEALERHRDAHPHWTPTVEDLLAHPQTRRPAPSSVYVFAPEYADRVATLDGKLYEPSCLRTDRPGTRAVIYRAHEAQGIVALFDVGENPRRDDEWGYVTTGRLHVLRKSLARAELLERPELARVFGPIQGRRRIPTSAQRPLQEILEPRFGGQLPIFRPVDDSGRD